jgi:hypothetical protein
MEVNDQLPAPAALHLGKDSPLHIEWETAWVPGPVWRLWGKEKSLAATGNRTTIRRLTISWPRLRYYGFAHLSKGVSDI